jgi:hypothetical protein
LQEDNQWKVDITIPILDRTITEPCKNFFHHGRRRQQQQQETQAFSRSSGPARLWIDLVGYDWILHLARNDRRRCGRDEIHQRLLLFRHDIDNVSSTVQSSPVQSVRVGLLFGCMYVVVVVAVRLERREKQTQELLLTNEVASPSSLL